MRYGTIDAAGDVQPYLNLAITMVEHGWNITLGAPEEFRRMVEGKGIHFADIGPSPSGELYSVRIDAHTSYDK